MDKLKKAKELINSARNLFENGDLAGVAGLAYQAVEAAIMHLTDNLKTEQNSIHTERRKKAEILLKLSKETLKSLWFARNIDFYGNEKIGGEEKELDKRDIQKSLEQAESIIQKVEK